MAVFGFSLPTIGQKVVTGTSKDRQKDSTLDSSDFVTWALRHAEQGVQGSPHEKKRKKEERKIAAKDRTAKKREHDCENQRKMECLWSSRETAVLWKDGSIQWLLCVKNAQKRSSLHSQDTTSLV